MIVATLVSKPTLYVGDRITDPVTKTRWIVTELDRASGEIVLVSSNTLNSPSEWSTTLDRLPERMVW